MSAKISTDDVRISEIWSLISPEVVIRELCPS